MRINLTTLLTFLTFSINLSFAQQIDSLKKFIIKFGDLKPVFGNTVSYSTAPFRGAYILLDSTKVNASEIKFFQNEKGFFANIKNVSAFGENAFSAAFRVGKINFFYRTNIYMSSQSSMSNTKYYYSKGFGDLKKPSYNNLSEDMKDNLQSLAYLNLYKRNRSTTTTLCIMGGSLLATAVGLLANSVGHDKKPIPSIVVGGVGVIMFWTAAGVKSAGLDHLGRAVDEYNK